MNYVDNSARRAASGRHIRFRNKPNSKTNKPRAALDSSSARMILVKTAREQGGAPVVYSPQAAHQCWGTRLQKAGW
jgi:hypothetical protein